MLPSQEFIDKLYPYSALVAWPDAPAIQQQDWIDSFTTLESWLDQHVGTGRWTYGSSQRQEYWQACIAFMSASDRTMFILRWAN
jgi:hypothetical protein